MRKKYIVTIDTDDRCPHTNKEILMHINDLAGGDNAVRIEDWED